MKNVIFLLTILAVISSGCKDPFGLEDNKKAKDKNRNLEFVEIFNSNHIYQNDFTERQTVVIKSQAELDEFLSTMTNLMFPNPDFPQVDFSEKMLFGIVLHAQSSGSYKLSITSVNMVDEVIEVSSELYIPSIGTDDIGYPIVFVELDRFDNEVKFLPTKEIKETNSEENFRNKTWKLKYTKNPNGSITDPEFYREADSQWNRVFLEPFTINFREDNTVNGMSNCNNWGAIFYINNDSISIFEMFSTEAACPYSDKYQTLLVNAIKISYSLDSLYIQSIINEEVYTLVYYYFNPQVENIIPRSAWRLSDYSEDGGVIYSSGFNDNGNEIYFVEHDFSLMFDNGFVTGNAKCEYIESLYTLDLFNKGISFTGFKNNGNDCAFKNEYITLLNKISSYDLKLGNLNMLTLYDNQKKNILRFTKDFTLEHKWLALDITFELESVATISSLNEVINLTEINNDNYTIKTNPNYTFSGSGDCNTFNGNFINYNDFGETNVILETTKVNCNDFENNFLDCLSSTTHFKWNDEKLILYNYKKDKEFNYLVFKMK